MKRGQMIEPQAASDVAWGQSIDAANQRDELLEALAVLLEANPASPADALALVGRIQERAGVADQFAYEVVHILGSHVQHLIARQGAAGASGSRRAAT